MVITDSIASQVDASKRGDSLTAVIEADLDFEQESKATQETTVEEAAQEIQAEEIKEDN